MTVEIKNEYQWNESFSSHSMDVNEVVKELHSIQEEKGEISPQNVVEQARSKHSVLHNYFVWDNKTAADKYRLQQASELLRRIEVKVIKDGESKTLRAFEVVSRPLFAISNYLSFDLSNGFERAKQIVESDLNRCLSRLSPYSEYSAVIRHIEKTIKELSKVSTETKEQIVPVLSTAN